MKKKLCPIKQTMHIVGWTLHEILLTYYLLHILYYTHIFSLKKHNKQFFFFWKFMHSYLKIISIISIRYLRNSYFFVHMLPSIQFDIISLLSRWVLKFSHILFVLFLCSLILLPTKHSKYIPTTFLCERSMKRINLTFL